MSSNLPPGVTESMIPGNTPEDAIWENVIDWICVTTIDPIVLQNLVQGWVKRKNVKVEKAPYDGCKNLGDLMP